MIIDVKKYLLLGSKDDLDRFFERAQAQGVIEFIPPAGKKPVEFTLEIHHLLDALKILRKLPVKKAYDGGGDLFFADDIAVRIIELKAEVEKLSEEKRLVEGEISRVAPFGDFSLDDIDYIEREGKLEIQFFCMKSFKSKETQFPEEVIYIGTDYDLDYFIAINKEPKQYPNMIEMRIDRPLGELQIHLNFVKESLHQLEAELKGYAGHGEFLHEALIEHLNEHNLHAAKKEVSYPLGESLFAVEAWVPVNKTVALFSVIDGMAVHCEPIKIEESDRIPTYMENKGIARMGEDLVHIYDTPAPTDKDPSLWVFCFFALFFAMIVADGGYGILYLALCLFLKFKFPTLKGAKRRFLKLGICLSVACVGWGVLTSEFFGLQIRPDSWIGEISLIDHLAVTKANYHFLARDDVHQFWVTKFSHLTNVASGKAFIDQAVIKTGNKVTYEMFDAFSDSILLEFSLVIGIIHISLAFLRYLFRHWAGLGWVVFMIGSYLYFPSMLNATSMIHFLGIMDKTTAAEVGLQVLYTGIAIALVLAIIQHRWKGLGEIAHMIQVFTDVLSYLRLYALGLAGTIMASTFNDMGETVGLFLGVLVVLIGHSLNIMLGIMAGAIHGLRLNFIEWYHHCFDGGGRLFRPLMRLKSKEH